MDPVKDRLTTIPPLPPNVVERGHSGATKSWRREIVDKVDLVTLTQARVASSFYTKTTGLRWVSRWRHGSGDRYRVTCNRGCGGGGR